MAHVDTAFPLLRDRRVADTAAALAALFAAMRAEVAARWSDGAKRLVAAEWDRRLAEVVLEQNLTTASEVALRVAEAFGEDFDPTVMRGWLEANAAIAGEQINQHTEAQIRDVAAAQSDPVAHVFDLLVTSSADGMSRQMVTRSAGFAARDTGEKLGAAVKVWRVNSTRPRTAHARMNGQSVPIRGVFSNGMDWPGDPAGGAANNAHCKCSLTIVR